MTTAVKGLTGKATAKGTGEGGAFPIPSENNHCAYLVAMVDLGHHMETFKEKTKKVHKWCFVYELDEQAGTSGFNFLVTQELNLSFVADSNSYKLYEKIMNTKLEIGSSDMDYGKLIGMPCMVTIEHVDSSDKSKKYANIKKDGISGVPAKFLPSFFKPQRSPILWTIDQDTKLLPDWLPRSYGKILTDIMQDSLEYQQADDADQGNETPSGDTGATTPAGGNPDDPVPF